MKPSVSPRTLNVVKEDGEASSDVGSNTNINKNEEAWHLRKKAKEDAEKIAARKDKTTSITDMPKVVSSNESESAVDSDNEP
jgi:hypothetical protein